jgi:uncharacterized protein YukE
VQISRYQGESFNIRLNDLVNRRPENRLYSSKKHEVNLILPVDQMPPTGVEPVTSGLGNQCSIQLSYEGVGLDDIGRSVVSRGAQTRGIASEFAMNPRAVRGALGSCVCSSTMSSANVDPADLRRFAHDLNRFNNDLQQLLSTLNGKMRTLEQTWRDQEQKKFSEQFAVTVKALANFSEVAHEHVQFLSRKAGLIEDYLKQR